MALIPTRIHKVRDIGTKQLRVSIEISREQVYELAKEQTGKVFVFSGVEVEENGDVFISLTPGNGLVIEYHPDTRGWLRKWWDRMIRRKPCLKLP